MTTTQTLFDFTKDSNISDWKVVNDGVMGGLSEGEFYLNDAGNAVFKGTISLENNGGFSSIRYDIGTTEIPKKTKVVIRLKGDGKRYQFRLKQRKDDYYSFVAYFETSGDWETIEIPLNEFYPTFRGNKLDMSNFNATQIEELGILIGNKKKENFLLELDSISME